MKPKVVYIISNITRWVGFEWVATGLKQKDINLEFILLNPDDSYFENFLKEQGIPVSRIKHTGLKDIFSTLPKLIKALRKIKPDYIHAHFLDASVIGMIAGKLAGIKNRIYTRRHSTSHHMYNKKGVFYDNLANKFSTHIIATCQNVKDVLMEKESIAEKKITVIHHGFKIEDFDQASELDIERIKTSYNPNSRSPVVGVVARQIELKGIHYIVPAFKKFVEKYPNALLILANGYGDKFSHVIDKQLDELPKDSYVKIFWEDNLFALYKNFDFFVHTPIDPYIEAYGQVYIEALSAGVPSVVTASGIAKEMLSHRETAMVVDFKNSDAIYYALVELMEDTQLRARLKNNSRQLVLERLNVETMINKLEQLYV